MTITNHIESNPKIMLGKPTIKGTRITVELVLTKLSDGYSTKEIIGMYPHIKEVEIKACIAYAAQMVQSEQIIQAA